MAALPIDLDSAAKDAAGDADRLWGRLAHLESGCEDLGGREENRGGGAGTPLHIIREAWSTNQGPEKISLPRRQASSRRGCTSSHHRERQPGPK
jgi:hypothetical protein